MAKVNLLAPKILKWEGGYSDDPDDKGGATNMGVTVATWKQVGYDKDGDGHIDGNDIKLLTKEDAILVLKKFYWDRWHGDYINNQSVADILVDWVWCSGKWGIKIPQRLLMIPDDGAVGAQTISTLNAQNQGDFHMKVRNARLAFIDGIVKNDPSQEKFKQGWINRLNDFTFSNI